MKSKRVDELNRVTEKKYDDVLVVTYSYDTQPAGSPISILNPIGRITKIATTTEGVTASNYFSYCNCSAVSQEATVIQDGTTKTYITSYAYNYVGAMTSMTYPNGRVVIYTRDSEGRETRVHSVLGGPSPIEYVRSTKYLGPQGGLTEIEHGFQNGVGNYVKTNFTYSPTTMRMTNLQTFGLNLNFRYEVPGMSSKQTGHIYDIDDVYDPQTGPYNRHLEYNRWYRLTKWWIYPDRTATPATVWSYDNYGNVTSRIYAGGTPTNYTIDASTNRLTGPSSYGYDLAGNMKDAPGSVTRIFDAENRMTSTGPSGLSFLYDGSGRRLRKMVGTTKIYFVYSATGRLLVEDQWTTPTTTKDHIYFNGQLIATRDQSDSVKLLFKDHLGSTRSVVKVNPPTGGESWGLDWITSEVYNYYPYGDVYASYFDDPAQQVTQKFTGQKRDSESNLDYFGARYYDSGLGTQGNPRWISPDPIMNRPTVPEMLNKYAYARTDPVNSIDSNGLYATWNIYGCWFYGFDCIDLEMFQDPPLPIRGGGGTGGGGGATASSTIASDTAWYRAEGNSLLDDWAKDDTKGCGLFFKDDIGKLRKAVDSLRFLNLSYDVIARFHVAELHPDPLVLSPIEGAYTVMDYWNAHNRGGQGMYMQSLRSSWVFVAPGLSSRATMGSIQRITAHEAAHRAFQRDDIQLAGDWGLGTFATKEAASQAISDFLRDNCEHKK